MNAISDFRKDGEGVWHAEVYGGFDAEGASELAEQLAAAGVSQAAQDAVRSISLRSPDGGHAIGVFVWPHRVEVAGRWFGPRKNKEVIEY